MIPDQRFTEMALSIERTLQHLVWSGLAMTLFLIFILILAIVLDTKGR